MKLQDNIKKKLEARRIEPTAAAWDRIAVKLDTEQGKKKSKVVLWMAIAASFVAGVFLTALIFSGSTTSIDNELVITNETLKNVEDIKAPSIQLEKKETNQLVLVTENEEKATEDKLNERMLSRKRTAERENVDANEKAYQEIYKPTTQNSQKVKTAIAATEVKQEVPVVKNVIDSTENIEAIAAIDQTTVTDAEVNALLEDALLKVKEMNTISSKVTTVVDANELLLDAEAEVDPASFKDKVFKTIKKQFGKAVEAVANKDN